jgi:hypothetical protein
MCVCVCVCVCVCANVYVQKVTLEFAVDLTVVYVEQSRPSFVCYQ